MKRLFYILTLMLGVAVPSLQAQQTVTGKLTVTGDVQAGTSTSADDFELRLDGTLYAVGSFGTGSLLTADQAGGTKLIWLPGKAAFLAGYRDSWANADIGAYSVALGYNNIASGDESMATGYYNVASGPISTALGSHNSATWQVDTAIGAYNISSGFASFAGGGGLSISAGWGSFAFGKLAYAGTGTAPVAMGNGTTSNGDMTAAFNDNTTAISKDSFVVGRYNLGASSSNPWTWVATDPLFEVGNGSDATHPADAVIVYKNGNMTVQGAIRCSPGGDLSMGSFTAGTHP